MGTGAAGAEAWVLGTWVVWAVVKLVVEVVVETEAAEKVAEVRAAGGGVWQ